jgi:acetoin utilization protein AcuC
MTSFERTGSLRTAPVRPNLGVCYGKESLLYSFPGGHPMNNARTQLFGESLTSIAEETAEEPHSCIEIVTPTQASSEDVRLFHTERYIEIVKESSISGSGYLDFPDTPSFQGVYEASMYAVGGTLIGLDSILRGEFSHFFNPVGGLHHAARDGASGFCVFNDSAIAISRSLNRDGMKKVAYVDIDAHHGDGVYYGFESDPRVIIADIHEDGRSLFPGTGDAGETGKEFAEGTKLNLPLDSGSGDDEFFDAFDKAFEFVAKSSPEFIFLQCGADGLKGDPLTHLRYSPRAHAYAASRLHELAHDTCEGRLLAMGGGGYDARNVDAAWTAVVKELSRCE